MKVEKLVREGKNHEEIRKELNITRQNLYYHMRRLGIIKVKRDDLKLIFQFYLDNASNLPTPNSDVSEALNNVFEVIGGDEE